MDDSALAETRRKIQEVDVSIEAAEAANRISMRAILMTLAVTGWLLYAALSKAVPAWSVAVPLPALVAAGRWHGKNRDKQRRLARLRKFHEQAVARIQDRWHGAGFSGEEFRDPHHVYSQDLQILGEGSLFELLGTARTGIGRRWLADYLLRPRGIPEAMARQETVRELTPQTGLREQIGLLGKFSFQESAWDVFSEWVAAPPAPASGWVRTIGLASSVSLTLLALAGFCTSIPWGMVLPPVAPLLIILMSIAWYYRQQTGRLNTAASRVGVDIGLVREGIELIGRMEFRAEKLLSIQRRLNGENAAAALRGLERLTEALAECEKPYFELFAYALAARTQLCLAIEQWKQAHGGRLEGWLEAWGEFDALAALSGYAWENPGDTFPEFGEGEAVFAARDLGHPLIPVAACVRNDVTLDRANRFYVISGSNMAGKSTLLRSIGVNAVLAAAGAPVRASSMRLTQLEVFASLSIVDSILEGKSKFLAEVERVRMMLECSSGAPVLFLIDEILSGTNSRDRRIASEAVIRALVANGAIGALSTHDLALTEIAGMDGLAGANVHMGARQGDDPMDFDYLLKPGVTKETNALAIAAMMGVRVSAASRP